MHGVKDHFLPSYAEFWRGCGGASGRGLLPSTLVKGSRIPPPPHLDFLGVEEVGVLGAVHQDLGPVPVLGAPRAVPPRRLVATLPLQRGPLAARVAHGEGLRGPLQAGRCFAPGKGQGTTATSGSHGPREGVGAPSATPLGRRVRAGSRSEAGEKDETCYPTALSRRSPSITRDFPNSPTS